MAEGGEDGGEGRGARGERGGECQEPDECGGRGKDSQELTCCMIYAVWDTAAQEASPALVLTRSQKLGFAKP